MERSKRREHRSTAGREEVAIVRHMPRILFGPVDILMRILLFLGRVLEGPLYAVCWFMSGATLFICAFTIIVGGDLRYVTLYDVVQISCVCGSCALFPVLISKILDCAWDIHWLIGEERKRRGMR